MMSKILFLSILTCIGLAAGSTTTASTPKVPSTATPAGNKGQKPSLFVSVRVTKRRKRYFTAEWKKLFSPKQLEKQPKWFLPKGQPTDGSFQVRRYERHWVARSWKKCRTGKEASQQGYFDLYLYFNGYSYQRTSYPLTYPVMIAMNNRKLTPATTTKPTPMPSSQQKSSVKTTESATPMTTPAPCSPRYITQFYIPIPITKWPPLSTSKTVRTFKRGGDFYVREYQGNATTEYCAGEANQLATDLNNNGRKALENYWICAHYASATGTGSSKLEVWMIKRR